MKQETRSILEETYYLLKTIRATKVEKGEDKDLYAITKIIERIEKKIS